MTTPRTTITPRATTTPRDMLTSRNTNTTPPMFPSRNTLLALAALSLAALGASLPHAAHAAPDTPAAPTAPTAPDALETTPVVVTPRASQFKLGLEALTTMPVHIGARVQLEMPHRLRLGTSLGYMPGFYVDLVNAFGTGLFFEQGYTDDVANLIDAALKDSLIFNIDFGWRPFANNGFYFNGGYQLATLGGGLSGAELIEAVSGQAVERDRGERVATQFNVASQLHMVTVELGYETPLYRGLYVRTAIGGAFTVAASTTVEAESVARTTNPARALSRDRAITAIEQNTADYLDDIYTSYVFTPTLTLALGYNFDL